MAIKVECYIKNLFTFYLIIKLLKYQVWKDFIVEIRYKYVYYYFKILRFLYFCEKMEINM